VYGGLSESKRRIKISAGTEMKKHRLIVALTMTTLVITLVYSSYLYQKHTKNPFLMLERELENLRDKGIPIEYIDMDEDIGCLIAAFRDMEYEYVQPVREIVGYEQPILFRELEPPRVLVGDPPAPLLDICRALNTLEESLDLRAMKSIDFERGLLRLEFLRDLTQLDVEEITLLVGKDVPVEYVEREWKDRLYVGEPLFVTQNLEDALTRIYESESNIVENSISGSGVDEERGMLRIGLWKLDDYTKAIEAIRDIIGEDTPVAFVLHPYIPPEPRNFTSATAVLEDYVNILNLTDVGFEIIRQSDDEAVGAIQFVKNGNRIKFQELQLEKHNSTWHWCGSSKWGTLSPSYDIEVVGYLVRIGMLGNRKCVCRVEPLVENLGEGTAYIYSFQVEIRNYTHTLHQSYATVSKGLWDGLIKAEKIDIIGAITSRNFWITENEEFITLSLDSVAGKTYKITIVLKDGEDNVLATKSYTHTFSIPRTKASEKGEG